MRDAVMATTNDPNNPTVSKTFAATITLALVLAWSPTALGQLPNLPGAAAKPAPPPKADPSKKPIPAKDSPGAVFSTTSGPIAVDKKVDDSAIAKTLKELLDQFPGVYKVDVHVKDGAVTLNGHVDDDDSLDDVTAFSEKVEGVRLVLNRMKTDAEVLTGREMAAKVLNQYLRVVQKNWLLAILAVFFMMAFGMLARSFARSSETMLAPFIRNPLLRSVVGSILSTLIVLTGILLGLSVLNLTHAVVSVLGLAGVVGLALGFAFKDIAENFIASMLLGVRRPFQIGDFITVAGKSGSVLSLNTRATLLITPDGNHVRIPNAVIYKETLVNASTTPSALGSIDLTIPYEASTAGALEAINEALQSTEGLLPTPTPRALVQDLEPGGVHLRATYWMPNRGIDGDKLQSDLRLRIKVALQQLGITSPTTYVPPTPPTPTTTFDPKLNGNGTHPAEPSTPATDQAEVNLRKDTEAVHAVESPAAPEVSPIDHAIKQAEANAAAEGNNMLVNAKS
jgi:small conductance mechanosensitive channel